MINKTYFDKKTNKKIKLLYLFEKYGYGITNNGEIIKVSLDDLEEESSEIKELDEEYLNKVLKDLIEIEKLQNNINEMQEKIFYLVDDKNMIKR